MSIGAVARATGIPVETLRTWEARYGYPRAQRRPSGHRVYDPAVVTRLRRIAAALGAGHRAGDVVGARDAELDTLLAAAPAPTPTSGAGGVAPGARGAGEIGELLDRVRALEGAELRLALSAAWSRRQPLAFLEEVVGPLLVAIGEAWSRGEIGVRHEHFAAEVLKDVLRGLRQPLEVVARGPRVLCATLPGEQHGLGLMMAALALAAAGARPLLLGVDLPLEELQEAAREVRPDAVALSVSRFHGGASTRAHLTALRAVLPAKVALLVGGAGAPRDIDGTRHLGDLRALADWAAAPVARAA